jgi:hypothetical protein
MRAGYALARSGTRPSTGASDKEGRGALAQLQEQSPCAIHQQDARDTGAVSI